MRTTLTLLALVITASLAYSEKADPAPASVDDLLRQAKTLEITALRGPNPTPLIVRDAAAVKLAAQGLAARPRYRGQPAGWIHEIRVVFVLADGRRVVTHTMSPDLLARGGGFISVRAPKGAQGGGERIVSPALARALAPHLQRAEKLAQAAPALDVSGRWEGQVLFSTGHRARALLTLERAKQGFRGRYELRVLDEEGAGAPQAAPVQATLRGDQLTLTIGADTFRARLGEAGSYAEHALYGTFKGAKREGVFMLHRFRKR